MSSTSRARDPSRVRALAAMQLSTIELPACPLSPRFDSLGDDPGFWLRGVHTVQAAPDPHGMHASYDAPFESSRGPRAMSNRYRFRRQRAKLSAYVYMPVVLWVSVKCRYYTAFSQLEPAITIARVLDHLLAQTRPGIR